MLQWIQTIWAYNYWAHRKVWDCILSISEQDFKRPVDYSMGSVHEQIVHVMFAEAVWFSRIQGYPMPPTFTTTHYPTHVTIRAKWDEIEADWRDYIGILTDTELNRKVEITTTDGEHFVHTIKEIMIHVVNHGTDHRSQILELIDGYGGQTFEQDLIYYLREQQGG